jgi:hypothetical protein
VNNRQKIVTDQLTFFCGTVGGHARFPCLIENASEPEGNAASVLVRTGNGPQTATSAIVKFLGDWRISLSKWFRYATITTESQRAILISAYWICNCYFRVNLGPENCVNLRFHACRVERFGSFMHTYLITIRIIKI